MLCGRVNGNLYLVESSLIQYDGHIFCLHCKIHEYIYSRKLEDLLE